MRVCLVCMRVCVCVCVGLCIGLCRQPNGVLMLVNYMYLCPSNLQRELFFLGWLALRVD